MSEDNASLSVLDLNDLLGGMPGLTEEVAAGFVQAAAVCLESHQHSSGTILLCTGSKNLSYALHWPSYPDKTQVIRAWGDMQYATENGAYAVAIALVKHMARKVVCARSAKGSGFDYWLSDEDSDPLLFQETSRLEVSGILAGDDTQISLRARQKYKQVTPTDNLGLTAYVVIVEFSAPRAKVVQK